jgi:RNA-directed DNA polymerase
VPLRTYPLVAHPAFVSFVEFQKGRDHGLHLTKPVDTPTHRPDIRQITDVADFLQISHFFLRSILRRPWRHYRTFHFKKRSGDGLRTINSPRTFLKVIQWWILDTILYNSQVLPTVHGFVPYKSFITNATEHVGAKYMLNVDVKDFFPSIKTPLVASIFETLGYSEKVSFQLARLVTLEDSLPQGAPTSPAIANLVMHPFDVAMTRHAREASLVYSRYADDITFSGNNVINVEVLELVRLHLSALGLSLNEKKTRFMGSNSAKEVTGLIIGREGPRLPKEYLNSARGWFFRVSRFPDLYRDELNRIRGTVAFIRQIGGAGSNSVIELGSRAIAEVERSLLKSNRRSP